MFNARSRDAPLSSGHNGHAADAHGGAPRAEDLRPPTLRQGCRGLAAAIAGMGSCTWCHTKDRQSKTQLLNPSPSALLAADLSVTFLLSYLLLTLFLALDDDWDKLRGTVPSLNKHPVRFGVIRRHLA